MPINELDQDEVLVVASPRRAHYAMLLMAMVGADMMHGRIIEALMGVGLANRELKKIDFDNHAIQLAELVAQIDPEFRVDVEDLRKLFAKEDAKRS